MSASRRSASRRSASRRSASRRSAYRKSASRRSAFRRSAREVLQRYADGKTKIEVVHREDGLNVTKTYFADGKKHREEWRKGTEFHRLGGPAVREWYANGKPLLKMWFYDGKYHREKGHPALILYDDKTGIEDRSWYIDGTLQPPKVTVTNVGDRGVYKWTRRQNH